jgi:hypothetical protein
LPLVLPREELGGAMTDQARQGVGPCAEVDIPLDPDASVEDLMEALREDPRVASTGAHVAITATRDGHKAFSGDVPNVITFAIAATAQVPATVLALWIYDCLKRHAQGIRSGNVATTFSRSNIEQALGAAPPIDLFVAFGRPVREQARIVREEVSRLGWWTFMDEDLSVGSEWADELPRALGRARTIAYLLSPDLTILSYLKSVVSLGIKAREKSGTHLFPFVVRGTDGKLPALPYGLDIIQAATWDPCRPLETVKVLHERLGATLGVPSGHPSAAGTRLGTA